MRESSCIFEKTLARIILFLFYFILLASPTQIQRVIKQNNKEKVAGIPQQREPVTTGPEN